jgi:hypothetical protein
MHNLIAVRLAACGCHANSAAKQGPGAGPTSQPSSSLAFGSLFGVMGGHLCLSGHSPSLQRAWTLRAGDPPESVPEAITSTPSRYQPLLALASACEDETHRALKLPTQQHLPSPVQQPLPPQAATAAQPPPPQPLGLHSPLVPPPHPPPASHADVPDGAAATILLQLARSADAAAAAGRARASSPHYVGWPPAPPPSLPSSADAASASMTTPRRSKRHHAPHPPELPSAAPTTLTSAPTNSVNPPFNALPCEGASASPPTPPACTCQAVMQPKVYWAGRALFRSPFMCPLAILCGDWSQGLASHDSGQQTMPCIHTWAPPQRKSTVGLITGMGCL